MNAIMLAGMLARGFKSATGLTPHAFTTAQRLNRAKDLLLRSGQAVAEVAYEVGFSNRAHFRRLFRREFGVNPSQLREHHQST